MGRRGGKNPPARSFAPGLAKRKPKVDPYDPEGVLAPEDPYTFMEEKQDAEVSGTWTTVDVADGTRRFDRRWHEQRSVSGSAAGSATWSYQAPFTGGPSTSRASSSAREATPYITRESLSPLDDRMENPDIDVDPEIRAKFRPIQNILEERAAPRSAFDQRNQRIMAHSTAAPSITVMIGDRVLKTLERKGDVRAQYQDRFGNYVGEDLGAMKKHLVEERRSLIKLRDDEMVRATQEKRTWDAMSPREKEEHIARKQAPMKAFLAGCDGSGLDEFEYDDMPEIYLRRVTADEITAWSAPSQRAPAASVASDDLFVPVSDFEGFGETSVAGRRGPKDQASAGGRSFAPGRSKSTARLGALTTSVRKAQAPDPRSISASSVRSDTPGLDPGPRLAPLADIFLDQPSTPSETSVEQFERTKLLCSTRGRAVCIRLHNLVAFNPAAVVTRVFGGVLQEMQFHPAERTALIVFLLPEEAFTFIEHVQMVRENDAQGYRRLQVDAEWYGGDETEAVLPIQRGVFQAVVQKNATRVLRLGRIPMTTKREDLVARLRSSLGMILVNVALVKDQKRHIRELVGHSAILEFASIKDAHTALQSFRRGAVAGFVTNPVGFLCDPCDRPAEKSRGCLCRNCSS